MPESSRQVVLAARPKGWPRLADLRIEMNDYRQSYVPLFELGQPLDGGAMGVVLESRATGFADGDVVEHGLGWRAAGKMLVRLAPEPVRG